jgi:hypothetical protein
MRRIALRLLVAVAVIAAFTAYFLDKDPVRGIDLGGARLMSSSADSRGARKLQLGPGNRGASRAPTRRHPGGAWTGDG